MKKQTIPASLRRGLARRAGVQPDTEGDAPCHYCGVMGSIKWWPGRAWVSFQGLEMDHVVPEAKGGPTELHNIVLACRRCNRSKGHHHARPPALQTARAM